SFDWIAAADVRPSTSTAGSRSSHVDQPRVAHLFYAAAETKTCTSRFLFKESRAGSIDRVVWKLDVRPSDDAAVTAARRCSLERRSRLGEAAPPVPRSSPRAPRVLALLLAAGEVASTRTNPHSAAGPLPVQWAERPIL